MFYADQESNAAYYGGREGGGFGGSAIMMVLVVVIVLWLLFKDGHRDGYDGGYRGYGYGDGCAPCVRPSFIDESNYEEERNLRSKMCEMDRDIWKTDCDVKECCCKEIEATHCEGEKTRALIEQNYIQDLRDKLAESNSEKLLLKQEMYNEKKFDQVIAAVAKTDRDIECLKCELPKRPPVFAECVTPNTHDVDCGDRFERGFPRRGRCDFDRECCGF